MIYGCLMHSAAVWVCGLGGGGNIGKDYTSHSKSLVLGYQSSFCMKSAKEM